MKQYKALGLMSGTSLDGLDLALVQFVFQENCWSFTLIESETISYDFFWQKQLENAQNLDSESLQKLHMDYGHYLGQIAAEFIRQNNIQPDLVASHGHTVFHNPQQGYTLQIGAGASIAAHLTCPVVFDFRSEDVALGGQGAPLVPIGDELLFNDFLACVNLGGFANISINNDGQRIAWDIGPANFILNAISRKLGYDFDENGNLARQGQLNQKVLKALNALDYYHKPTPKSMGREWVEEVLWPEIKTFQLSDSDLLRTFVEHISYQVSEAINGLQGKVLFSGGGVRNGFLMERIAALSKAQIVIPEEEIVDFKEAIIFAFMGVLRMENKVNILNSVTGASHSISAGSIVGKFLKEDNYSAEIYIN